MKFSELNIGDKFRVDEFPDIIFSKALEHGGNCCTGPHNATYHEGTPSKKNKKVMLFQQDKDVEFIQTDPIVQPNNGGLIRKNNIELEPKTGP